MSAQPLPPDRPILRLFDPERLETDGPLTVRRAYETFLVPELLSASRSTRADYARFVAYWEAFEACVAQQDPRTASPWVLNQVSTRAVTTFAHWLTETKGLGGSSVDKAVKAIRRIVNLAGEEGHKVNAIKTRAPRPKPAAKYYLDDLQIACLWSACDAQTWPSAEPRRTFDGSGMPPSTFWRAILILLRSYGMRVQDLVAYESRKDPVLWSDVTLGTRTPNPEGRADSPLGWLHYTASKTGREYYLPLTPATRAAIDRLRSAAIAATRQDPPPPGRPILPCPTGHGLGNHWRALQKRAKVAKPTGSPYQLEDFRKTCATYLDEHCPELAYHVCGWGTVVSVAHRHYINPELKLVNHLPTAPLPGCFRDWLPSA